MEDSFFKQEKLFEEKLATLRTNHPFMRELASSISRRKDEIGQVLGLGAVHDFQHA